MRNHDTLGLALTLALGTLFGCTDDGNGDESGGSGGEAGTDGSGETEAATGSGTGAGSDGGGDDTDDPDWEPTVARGIGVDWVEANQGVGVAIGLDGGEVGGDGRTAFLLANRPTMIRALWTRAEDWTPREIEARLRLHFPDGTSEVLTDRKTIDHEASLRSLGDAFLFGVVAEKVVPGLQYDLELYETEPGHEDASPAPTAARMPVEGTAHVGIEDSYQTLKTVVVPFDYDDGDGCQTSPDTSDATMQLFQDYMFQMNPIERLDFELHDPVPWNQALGDFNELNMYMSSLRNEENAPPEAYYYGLIDVCAYDLNGFGGQAYGIPTSATPGNAYQRVSSGLSLQPEWSADTFVHEVGHSQGRRHILCSGEEAGTNPSYPHERGALGEWGFGVLDFQLRHPTVNSDYMTYCHPAWVSTFGWNETYPVIKELSSWEGAQAPHPDGTLLVGSIYPDGRTDWTTVRGAVEGREDAQATFVGPDGRIVRHAAARIDPAADGDVLHVTLPVDEVDWTRVQRVVVTADDLRAAVAPVHIRGLGPS